jgi:hypothetical protein
MGRIQTMTSKAYFKILSVLHGAMVAGQTIFAIIIFLVVYLPGSGKPQASAAVLDPAHHDVVFYVAMGLVGACILASFLLFRMRVRQLRQKEGLSVRLTDYRSALLQRDVLLEGPGILCTIAFYTTLNERFLALSCLMIFLFLIWWPTRQRVIADIEMEGDPVLSNPDAIIP